MIPYSRQCLDEDDIQAVVDVLRSDWITTGPMIEKFEQGVTDFTGAEYGVAVSSGTAALHAAMYAIGVGPGDEVIVPPITFASTANAIVFQGATPVFADVYSDALLVDPEKVREKITPRTKAVIAVDFAGQPCDYDTLRSIRDKHNLYLVADACHALGAEYKGKKVGALADLTVFSFHPVKHITTGEGGMVVTDDFELAGKMRRFRNHGFTTDHRQRAEKGTWYYEMTELGYNYRITDFQCALGLSQLKKLDDRNQRRREIARYYDDAFDSNHLIYPLKVSEEVVHSYHLYVIQLDYERFNGGRAKYFSSMREEGIGINVHYIPVHLHPYYRKCFNTYPGLCPAAEEAYERIISLPLFPEMRDEEIKAVVSAAKKCSDSVRE